MRRWGIVCVSAVALAACSGGDDDASTTTAASASVTTAAPAATTVPVTASESTEPPATTGVPTTAPPVTTAPPATTEPPPTTAAPVTTEAPTTETTDASVEADVQARLDVLEQVEASWPAVRAVYNDPFNETLLVALDDYFVGDQLEGFRNVVQQLRDGNFRTVPRDGEPEIYEAEPRSLAIDTEQGRATVQVCHVNTSIVVETGANPDGSDRFVADDSAAQIIELDVRRVEGVWKVSNAREPEAEIATCP